MTVKNTHQALKFTLILAQMFAMFPANGVIGPNSSSLKFSWHHWKLFYTFLYIFMLFMNALLFVIKMSAEKLTFSFIVTLLFFSCSLVTTGLFIMLAKNWPRIMNKWNDIDDQMQICYGFPKRLTLYLNLITVTVISAAALEHGLFLAFAIGNTPAHFTALQSWNLYFQNSFSHIFQYIPYSFLMGCVMQCVNLFSTFTWNYMDLFIMVISTALAARFGQICDRIKTAQNSIKSLQFWSEVRTDYNNMNILCRVVDDKISYIVFLSFANNLFVILVQLLNSLEPQVRIGFIERFYFLYSFAFLILRTVAVSLLASNVNSKSKEILHVMSALPVHIYNVEMERLLQQIKMDPSALTGTGFFKVTKSLILTIAGAIVTYELILIQFKIH